MNTALSALRNGGEFTPETTVTVAAQHIAALELSRGILSRERETETRNLLEMLITISNSSKSPTEAELKVRTATIKGISCSSFEYMRFETPYSAIEKALARSDGGQPKQVTSDQFISDVKSLLSLGDVHGAALLAGSLLFDVGHPSLAKSRLQQSAELLGQNKSELLCGILIAIGFRQLELDNENLLRNQTLDPRYKSVIFKLVHDISGTSADALKSTLASFETVPVPVNAAVSNYIDQLFARQNDQLKSNGGKLFTEIFRSISLPHVDDAVKHLGVKNADLSSDTPSSPPASGLVKSAKRLFDVVLRWKDTFSRKKDTSNISSGTSTKLEPMLGIVRLKLEMAEFKGNNAKEIICRYESFVDSLVSDLRAAPAWISSNPTAFFDLAANIVRRNMTSSDVTSHTLMESAMENRWDCDCSAYLVRDALVQLGYSPKFIMPPNHALLKIGDLYLETASGEVLTESRFKARYAFTEPFLDENDFTAFVTYVSLAHHFSANLKDEARYKHYMNKVSMLPFSTSRIYRASELILAGNISEADTIYQSAVADVPNDPHARLHYSLFLRDQNRLPEAIKNMSVAIFLEPTRTQWHFEMSRMLFRANQAEDALVSVNDAISLIISGDNFEEGSGQPLDDDYVSTIFGLRGLILNSLGAHSHAISDYGRLLWMQPEKAAARAGRGIAILEKKQFAQASHDFHVLMNQSPEDGLGWLGLGLCYAAEASRTKDPRLQKDSLTLIAEGMKRKSAYVDCNDFLKRNLKNAMGKSPSA